MSPAPTIPPLLTLADWRRAYTIDGLRPDACIAGLRARMRADDPAWIHRCDDRFIATQLDRLAQADPEQLPLYGIPFAVKDNIDVAGLPTTAACPAFSRVAGRSARVVERLLDAGAVLIGKTNLDQFATGLVGTRSPYGAVPNTFDPAYVSGGSSSGSASVVARGLVPFALGTDTAGSGRIPAGFNNVVGLKPTPGRVPMTGVLPACRTLDVVSVFALTVADAAEIFALIEGAADEPAFQTHALRRPWFGNPGAPLRVGIPAAPACDAGLGYQAAFDDAAAHMQALGAHVEAIDMTTLDDVARLLYEGPWVAERYTVVADLLTSDPDALDPVVRSVIRNADKHDAADAFRARYQLESLRTRIAPLWASIDVLMVPTAPTCPTRAAVAAEPVLRNSELGRFTNFVNLLGMAALAVPSSITPRGVPFGVTFIAPGGSDAALAALGNRWQERNQQPLGTMLRAPAAGEFTLRRLPAHAPTLELAVVGAHLRGMPLHHQLEERGCRLIRRATTAPCYRLYALAEATPPKPGLVRVADGGTAIELELYEMPLDAVGSFLASIPPPLGLGSVELDDHRWVKGFICEPAGVTGARDITQYGGWRAYVGSTIAR